jgi:hypothetical protein
MSVPLEKRPELPESLTWIVKTPPMASALLEHLNSLSNQYNAEPIKQPGNWQDIEKTAKSQFWPTSLLLMVRQGVNGIGGDATGLVPRLIGKIDDPEEICSIVDSTCNDRVAQAPEHLRVIITDLLLEKYTYELSSSFSEAVTELDTIIRDVHEKLNQFQNPGLTQTGRKFRLDNQLRLLQISGYTSEDLGKRLLDPESYKNDSLVSPFRLIPEVNDKGLVIGVKQKYLLPTLSENNAETLKRLTPTPFRSENPDPIDPNNPHFYARRLLRGGQPFFWAVISKSRELEQKEKQNWLEIYRQIYPQKPRAPLLGD